MVIQPKSKPLNEGYNVSELLEASYDSSDDIFMIWGEYKIWIPLKYSIGEIFWDLFLMIEDILFFSRTEFNISWSSSAFTATWKCKLKTDRINIKAYWTSIPGGKPEIEKLLPLILLLIPKFGLHSEK